MSGTPKRGLLATLAVLAIALAGPGSGHPQSDEPPPPEAQETIPEFTGGEIEQVTVDVVVLDKEGEPVTGLTQADFTVLDEGARQEITSFELIDRQPGASPPETEAAPRVVTNLEVATERPGRTFVILFDDIHIAPLNAKPAKAAVAAFLDKGVVEGDRVTLVATSGNAWWSTRMKRGREDLIAVLQRLNGMRLLDPPTERITDYEAIQIVEYRNIHIARRVQLRFEKYGTALLQPMDPENRNEAFEFFQRGVVDPYIEAMASRVYLRLKDRLRTNLRATERVLESLAEGRDKKSLLLVSDGFAEDPTQPALKRVIEAARRVNATLYFIDSGGLRSLSRGYTAEFGTMLDPGDRMAAIADLSMEAEGSNALALDTGGFSIRDTNAFDEGAVRIGRESQSYYLLGYIPGDIPHDGRFRKIKVKIDGDYEIRARRGYYAPSETQQVRRPYRDGVDPTLQNALDAASFADAIPLRMTAFTMNPIGLDRSQAFVVADVDISGVDFAPDANGNPVASLDTLTVVAHRDSDDFQRRDQTVDIRRQPGSVESPTWYSFVRDFEIRPGEHQVKLVVRDTATDRVGSVVLELSAPEHDQFRISTPILTDIMNYPPGGIGGVPALITRRTFQSGAPLYCRFDVYGAADSPDGLPRVEAGYTLRRKGGDIVSTALPSRIEPTSLGSLGRLLEIPLNGVAPGQYELVLRARDGVTGESRELIESFQVAAPVSARR